ncbi:hypothetical protein GFS31_44310 (plasmid) [Leptolyngbya sp. BL0902]|uniref:DUF4007 family protein n=1 Tax=Leptolyngbya sp. BL0902 TaxID=1115757 RepID=UPI0018E87294|nr:DUF4007 family protein [Leptolyngbya sp. BL0902]QQE67718.1 hypothetical protein GFS31_44310 [Leptolyngbya sp. BL0902]
MAKAALTQKPQAPAVFARHETFHPRFGWLKKGYDLALADPGIFLRDDAPVLLGVGKNMVRSIRYWCNAFKVLTEEDGQIRPARLGQQLLDDDGWDPFLENPASLWLLHWNLLKAPCTATAWAFAFGEFSAAEFTPEHLIDELRDYANGFSANIADSSLRKDVSCILRMYADQDSKKGPTEDSIDCPFTALRLLYSVGDGRRYEFQVGPKETLPAEIVVAACLEFAGISENESSAMGVSRLAHLEGSPGRAFKLSESAIAEAIEQVARRREDLFISDSAGLLQLQYAGDPLAMSEAILNKYFAG